MPGFDKTGPSGQGSRTGRRMGNCNSENVSNSEELINRLGRELGRRFGRGFRFKNSGNFFGPGRRAGSSGV